MVSKKILCRERLRRVPEHFSWVDHPTSSCLER